MHGVWLTLKTSAAFAKDGVDVCFWSWHRQPFVCQILTCHQLPLPHFQQTSCYVLKEGAEEAWCNTLMLFQVFASCYECRQLKAINADCSVLFCQRQMDMRTMRHVLLRADTDTRVSAIKKMGALFTTGDIVQIPGQRRAKHLALQRKNLQLNICEANGQAAVVVETMYWKASMCSSSQSAKSLGLYILTAVSGYI